VLRKGLRMDVFLCFYAERADATRVPSHVLPLTKGEMSPLVRRATEGIVFRFALSSLFRISSFGFRVSMPRVAEGHKKPCLARSNARGGFLCLRTFKEQLLTKSLTDHDNSEPEKKSRLSRPDAREQSISAPCLGLLRPAYPTVSSLALPPFPPAPTTSSTWAFHSPSPAWHSHAGPVIQGPDATTMPSARARIRLCASAYQSATASTFAVPRTVICTKPRWRACALTHSIVAARSL
jgi:hypothetical protein